MWSCNIKVYLGLKGTSVRFSPELIQVHYCFLQSLLMSSAFSFGCLYLARFEELGLGIQWHNIWDSPLPNDDMNFAYALIMLAADGLIYGLIGWYISNVFPGTTFSEIVS